MSKIGESIICGLKEAVNYMEGGANPGEYVRHDFAPANILDNVDVKAIRQTL